MIRWRFGRWEDGGLPPREATDAWLCPEERRRLEGLRIPKRRDDWLVGRLNAKILVADAIAERYGVRPVPAAVHIDRLPSGAPVVRLLSRPSTPTLPPVLPLALSNSHSCGHALCGVAWLDGLAGGLRPRAIGVDLEWIEPRSDGFVRDFLTPPERAYCEAGEGRERHLRANLAWSAKEAVLKVFERGLSVDTYWLTCSPAPSGDGDSLAAALSCGGEAWAPLRVTCDPRFPTHGLAFHAAWRELDGFVATVAVGV